MSRFQQIMELLEPSPTFVYKSKSSFLLPFYPPLGVEEEESELGLGFTLDLLNPNPNPNSSEQMHSSFIPSEFFSASFDLLQLERTPFSSSFKRYQARSGTPSSLRSLCDRISALEAGFDKARKSARETDGGDRKYKWTAEIKGNGEERKYKLVADVKVGQERNYKLTAEMKGKGTDGPISRAYTFRSSAVPSGGAVVDGKKKKKEKAKGSAKVVEIEEADPAAHALQQVFAKRKALAIKNNKEKRKELSPQDAALIIQTSFRQHLVRRSQVLRALRELAVAKARLKEIRACFSNFYYRRRVAYNAEERQRFSEKIIVLLLTVEAIEGADLIVRATRRSMVDELEAMLEAVDPQPPEKLGSMKRRNFDLPLAGSVEKEMAAHVSEVVQMLDQDDNESSAFSGASP